MSPIHSRSVSLSPYSLGPRPQVSKALSHKKKSCPGLALKEHAVSLKTDTSVNKKQSGHRAKACLVCLSQGSKGLR